MEKITPAHGLAETPHAWIYYTDRKQNGIPLLMLHGNAQTHRIFTYYERVMSRTYRTILMDSRAHGRSKLKPAYEKKEFTTKDMAGDVAALLDHLGISSCILMGFSDGANIALEFASLFPRRTRAVVAVSGNISPDGLIFPLRWCSIVKYDVLRIMNRMGSSMPVFRRLQMASLLCHSPQLSKEELGRIKAPVLLLAGTHDVVKTSHSRQMARWIQNAQLVLVKGAGHTAMFGQKQIYMDIIQKFLDTV